MEEFNEKRLEGLDEMLDETFDSLENRDNSDRLRALEISIELLRRAERNHNKIGEKAVLSVIMMLILNTLAASDFSFQEIMDSDDIFEEVDMIMTEFEQNGIHIE